MNLFAPFSVGIDQKNKLTIEKSAAEAAFLEIGLEKVSRCSASIKINILVQRLQTTKNHGVAYVVTNKPIKLNPVLEEDENKMGIYIPTYLDNIYGPQSIFVPNPAEVETKVLSYGSTDDFAVADGAILDKRFDIPEITKFDDGTPLTPNTPYYVTYIGFNGTSSGPVKITDSFGFQLNSEIFTVGENDPCDTKVEVISSASGGGYLPSCVWGLIHVSVSGCIAQLLYTALFQPTSYMFGLAGKFFDNTFYYSVSDGSYRSPFVVEGWRIVRDFVNLFFIFVLLYIAIATVLSLHGFKTKEMIINVVIIGLLINFSLFATQLIIDTSNILARVFYTSVDVKVTKKSTDGTSVTSTVGENNQRQLSEALVSLVNPQKLIIGAAKVGTIKKAGDQAQSESNSNGISNGTFILVTLLATAVNVVGIFVFLTVGLLFLARVIGLWLSMVFVPFAFFSYTVPQMQDISMLGWKKWWPETLKLAFLAPIFIFFLYLIIKFVSAADFLPKLSGASGAELIISIIFPFAFIMILLMQAKKLASKFAGEIGSAVTKAAVVGGGAVLGGAALTAAFAGRQTLGAIAKYTQNDSARDRDRKLGTNVRSHFTDEIKNKWNPIAYLNAARKTVLSTGKAATANIAVGVNKIGREKDSTGKVTKKGWFQRQTAAVKDKMHAEHELNEAAQKVTNNKDAKYSELDEPEAKKARDRVDRDTVSKAMYNGLTWDKLKAEQRETLEADHKMADDPKGEWSHSAETLAHGIGEHPAADMAKMAKANAAMGEFIQSLHKGSYDIRNMANNKSKWGVTGAGMGMALLGIAPIIGGILALNASGAIKTGLKKGLGVDHGTGQKDFFKDLDNTLTSALSGLKIDVKVDTAGHGKAEAKGGGEHH